MTVEATSTTAASSDITGDWWRRRSAPRSSASSRSARSWDRWLPFVRRRLGFDPASASAPFVATLVDVTGLVIYFTVALVILRGTLLERQAPGGIVRTGVSLSRRSLPTA
jgi:hypothetical protein